MPNNAQHALYNTLIIKPWWKNIQGYICEEVIWPRILDLMHLSLLCWTSCFISSGGHRLREAGAVSVSRERESETEPERDPRPPAAAVNHPVPVQHHAHQGETHQHSRELIDALPRQLLVTSNANTCNWLCFICSARRMKTSAAECSSWRCPCSSVLSSCRSWSVRVNKASGGEERSWGNERTEWGSYSWSWTEREARSQW